MKKTKTKQNNEKKVKKSKLSEFFRYMNNSYDYWLVYAIIVALSVIGVSVLIVCGIVSYLMK